MGQYQERSARKMYSILHLVGSSESDRLYQTSLLYAGACQSYGKYEFMYAVIDLDKNWTFTSDLKTLEDETDSKNGIKTSGNVTLHLSEALKYIATEVQPDAAIHHIYDEAGSAFFRMLMEMLDIPLVGSSSDIVAIAKNKAYTRGVLSIAEGIPMAKAVYINRHLIQSSEPAHFAEEIRSKIGFPCVVKAASTEDSKGVFLVHSEDDLKKAVEEALGLGDDVVVEKFIPGQEIRCAVIEEEDGSLQLLPIFEYNVENNGIRSFDLKYEYDDDSRLVKSSQSQITVLKSTDAGALWNNVRDVAMQIFKVMKLRDFGLFDFRVHEETGVAYLLEVNLFCSFGSASVVNTMAREHGYTDEQLLQMVINKAVSRSSRGVILDGH